MQSFLVRLGQYIAPTRAMFCPGKAENGIAVGRILKKPSRDLPKPMQAQKELRVKGGEG